MANDSLILRWSFIKSSTLLNSTLVNLRQFVFPSAVIQEIMVNFCDTFGQDPSYFLTS